MSQKLSPNQLRRIEEIRDFQKVVDHVKALVSELDSNRAAKAAVITNICGTLARELSQLRQRALTTDVGTLADIAGALAVLAGRSGGGINFKIRGLTEGVNSLTLQLEQSLKMALAPDSKGAPVKPS